MEWEKINISPYNHIFAPFLAAGSQMELSFLLVDVEHLDQVHCIRTEAAPLSALQGNLPSTISHTFC